MWGRHEENEAAGCESQLLPLLLPLLLHLLVPLLLHLLLYMLLHLLFQG